MFEKFKSEFKSEPNHILQNLNLPLQQNELTNHAQNQNFNSFNCLNSDEIEIENFIFCDNRCDNMLPTHPPSSDAVGACLENTLMDNNLSSTKSI